MGFELAPSWYWLTFDDGPLAGLEVRVRSAGTEAVMAIEEAPTVTLGTLHLVRPLMESFARLLIGWNLTEDGREVPCNRDEFALRDPSFVLMILNKWSQDVRDAINPSGVEDSDDSDEFDEADLPMMPLEAVS